MKEARIGIKEKLAASAAIATIAFTGCHKNNETALPTPTPITKPTETPKMPTATLIPYPTATATPEPTATSIPKPISTSTPEPTATTIPYDENLIFGGRKYEIEIGPEEEVNLNSINWYPDGHTSFMKNENGITLWISGGPYGYMTTGENLDKLDPNVQKVIEPSNNEDKFDRDYASPGSVVPGKNENELLMFYHGERSLNSQNFPFDAGIGLAISHDKGITWEKQGQIIKGSDERTNDGRVYGAGQPSAIIKDGYIYLYYTDWNNHFPDAIHLARAPIESDGMPGSWEKFNNGKFENKGMDGPSTPVVLPPIDGGYAALPDVSWNKYLESFLMVFEAKDGFYISTSNDALKWSESKLLLRVKTANDNPKPGDIWNSYPTLLDKDSENDRETGSHMFLVFSQGEWQKSPHFMVKQEIDLKEIK